MKTSVTSRVELAFGPGLTEAQARAIYRQGEEAVVFALLTQSKLIDQVQPDPAPGFLCRCCAALWTFTQALIIIVVG